MDLNAEVDNLVKASQAWIPMIMEYGSRVLLAVITLAIGWWLINKVTHKLGGLIALRNADLALQGFISSLANIILKILLVVSVASMIGVETTSFVAAIGAALGAPSGLPGALLHDPRARFSMIADGVHVHPAVVATAWRAGRRAATEAGPG